MKKTRVKRIIEALERSELKYRGCDICAHFGKPLEATDLPEDYNGLILSPCLGCGKNHECFQLDEERLIEEIELGLVSYRQAKQIRERSKQ